MEEPVDFSAPGPESAVRKQFPTWTNLLAILGVFLATNLLTGGVAGAVTGGHVTGLALFLSYTASFAVTVAFALRLARGRNAPKLIRLTFKGFHPIEVLWGLILMLAMNVVIEPVVNLFPKEWYDLVGERLADGGWAMFTAVVMAPLCEEILFRGIIQRGLVRKWRPVSGILIASAIFGLIHGIPQQIVAGFSMGIILGWIYYKTGSLLAAIVLHAINNALGVLTTLLQSGHAAELTLRQTLGNDKLYGGVYLLCALLLAGSLLMVAFPSKKLKPQ